MRTMYDATAATALQIPMSAQMVAGYDTDHSASQSIKWSATLWAMWPNATHVHICGDGTDVGDVLDIESGAASLDQIVGWLLARHAHTGIWKSLYYSYSLDSDVQTVLRDAGLDSALIPKWIAWYNDNASLTDVQSVVGVVAKQYTNGDAYDTSIVLDYWPGVDPAPVPPPLPIPEDYDMVGITVFDSSGSVQTWYVLTNGMRLAFPAGSFGDPASAGANLNTLPNLYMSSQQWNDAVAKSQIIIAG